MTDRPDFNPAADEIISRIRATIWATVDRPSVLAELERAYTLGLLAGRGQKPKPYSIDPTPTADGRRAWTCN